MTRMAIRCFPGDRVRVSGCGRQLCAPADFRTLRSTVVTTPSRLRVGLVVLGCWLWGTNALCQAIPPRPVTIGPASSAGYLGVQQGASGLGADVLRPRASDSSLRLSPPVLDAVIGEGIKTVPDSSGCVAADCNDARDAQGSAVPKAPSDVNSVAVPGKS